MSITNWGGIETHFYYSFFAGVCAAGGSVFGKLSGYTLGFENIVILYSIFGVFLGLMLVCNAAVLTLYVKALQFSESSFVPTISVSATNYVVSAVAGCLMFGEPLSFMWCLGTFLVLSGMSLIASDSQNTSKDKSI